MLKELTYLEATTVTGGAISPVAVLIICLGAGTLVGVGGGATWSWLEGDGADIASKAAMGGLLGSLVGTLVGGGAAVMHVLNKSLALATPVPLYSPL